jgi:hypothetical protein
MNFKSCGHQYATDESGCICQLDAKPFRYDPAYSHIYDGPQYTEGSMKLQALRFGFLSAANRGPVKSILDIGYGNGAFVKFVMDHRGIPVYGYDITGVRIKGLHIVESPAEVRVDVVTMWDVIEHIFDLSLLGRLKASTLVISTPYCQFPRYVSDRKWFDSYHHRKPNEHIRHFDEVSLRTTVEAYGWRMQAWSTHEDIVRKSPHGLANILTMAFQYQWT